MKNLILLPIVMLLTNFSYGQNRSQIHRAKHCLPEKHISSYSFSFLILTFFVHILLGLPDASAQQLPCLFDEHLSYLLQNDPLLEETIAMNEHMIHDMMEEDPQAIMNSVVYTVPVVFHVIHLGESVGTGTNISSTRIYQVLQSLNDDFRDVQNLGNDVEIEFCLAVRDPDGIATTGINRVSGVGVPNYANYGLIIGTNDGDIKNLSRWPNDQYLNIWIVSEIIRDPFTALLGYSSFPGSNPVLDGVVLREGVVGVSQFATAITHEVGHYFNLYHTFEGGNVNMCAPNNDCDNQGDHVCDTNPHWYLTSGCDENEPNDCTPNVPLGQLVHNHMSYFPPDCHYLFTEKQIMRMRAALMMPRASLLESLGCTPACTDAVADFTPSDFSVEVGESLLFHNTSTPSQASYVWTVEDQESTALDLNYTFNHFGPVLICLRASYNGCTNEHCELIEVVGVDDCLNPILPACELLYNGMFERNNVQIGVIDHYANLQFTNRNKVCNWINKWKSPFFCSNVGQDVFGLYTTASTFEESIVTEMEVPFIDGNNYIVTFEYYVGNASNTTLFLTDPTLIVGLSHSSDQGVLIDDVIIEELSGLWFDNFDVNNPQCLNPNTNFHFHTFSFHYTSDMGKHLYFQNFNTGPIDESIIYIRDVHIPTCFSCVTVPEFKYEIDECSVTFQGENLGDNALYYHWDFGDGISSSNQNVTHEYLFPGTFTVCLTTACAPEISTSECKEIEITGPCSDCTELPGVVAIACSELENESNTFMANFSTLIPNGYRICAGNELFFYSEEVIITVSSYEIIDNAQGDDLLNIGVLITSPINYIFSLAGATGFFNLCNSEGEMYCFSIEFSGAECTSCIEVETPSVATCNETLSDEDTFVYEGTVAVDVGASATFAGFLSTELGLEILSTSHVVNVWTVNYRITVENLNFLSTNVILYFVIGDIKLCVNTPIIVTEFCSELPEECVDEWDTKYYTCVKERGEYVEFHFYNMVVPNHGYTLCEGGLFGTIDGGGIIEVLSAQILGANLKFSLNILMPSNYNTHQTYYLRIYLCNARGETVCYLFPLELSCQLGSFQDPINVRSESPTFNPNFSFVPNPVNTSLYIEYPGYQTSQTSHIELVNLFGQQILSKDLSDKTTELDVSAIPDGMYVIRLLTNGESLGLQKVIILH